MFDVPELVFELLYEIFSLVLFIVLLLHFGRL